MFLTVEKSFKQNEDGSYTYEVPGLPEGDPDDVAFPTAHPPSRVRFSKKPIKVGGLRDLIFYAYLGFKSRLCSIAN